MRAPWLLVVLMTLMAACSGSEVISADSGPAQDLTRPPEVILPTDSGPADLPLDQGFEVATDALSDRPPGRCTSDRDCVGHEMGPVCDLPSGQCAPCSSSARGACPAGRYCTASNRCEPGCGADGDCAMDGGAFHCDPARHVCVGCSRDDQCPVGSVCGALSTCAPGCTEARGCGAGAVCCAGACRATAGDTAHCGACGRACSAPHGVSGCAAGVCVVAACETGFGDCDGLSSNGCETELTREPAHCGGCARACPAGPHAAATCSAGRCAITCAAGFADCNGTASDGCETDTVTSPGNCAECGLACPGAARATATCVSARCGLSCAAGFGDCDGVATNGCEVDFASDLMRCGTCATVCAGASNAAPRCVAGVCAVVCSPGFANCDGVLTNGCEAALDGTANCGRCGAACAPSNPLCAAVPEGFGCSSGCAGPQTRCGSSCVDTASAVGDCGGCGMACPALANAARTCTAGRCGFACNEGFADCDGSPINGCEVFLAADPLHCAACSTNCPAAARATGRCSAGRCGLACAPGFADCDGSSANGCEAELASSTAHCGACARACPARTNATASCAGGACVSVCGERFADCDGSPVNGCEAELATDNAHCGACGASCPSGLCAGGVCGALATCATIHTATPSAGSGIFTIDPDGLGGAAPRRVYCDMSTDGGGWTLVAYAPSGSVSALCTDTGVRNLFSLATGGGSYDGLARRPAASLAAAPIARRSREILFARSDSNNHTGDISGATVATKFAIPDPSRVSFLNSNPDVSGVDRGPCAAVTLTTVVGPEVSGAIRYTFAYTLSTSWTDTYPTSYGATDIPRCFGPGSSLGPSFASEYSGVGHARVYCWPYDPVSNGAYTYWHQGWWDPTGVNRTGSVSIWLR